MLAERFGDEVHEYKELSEIISGYSANKILGIILPLFFLVGWIILIYPMLFFNIITISNENSGTIIAIATIALVIATIWLAFDNRKIRLAQDKPWLYFYLKEEEGIVSLRPGIEDEPFPPDLYVKNVGKGPAIKIKFKVEPTNQEIQRETLSHNEESLIDEINPELVSKGIAIVEITYKDLNDYKRHQKRVNFKPEQDKKG